MWTHIEFRLSEHIVRLGFFNSDKPSVIGVICLNFFRKKRKVLNTKMYHHSVVAVMIKVACSYCIKKTLFFYGEQQSLMHICSLDTKSQKTVNSKAMFWAAPTTILMLMEKLLGFMVTVLNTALFPKSIGQIFLRISICSSEISCKKLNALMGRNVDIRPIQTK